MLRSVQRRQRGVAIITAMLLVAAAIAAVVPGAVADRIAIARMAKLYDVTQARMLARGIEVWAGQVVLKDGRTSLNDHLGESWAKRVDNVPVQGAVVAGALSDQQGLFNINTLLVDGRPEPLAVERFERLLAHLGIDEAVVGAVLDWLDSDEEARVPGGAESVYYLRGEAPYRVSNQPMALVSELMLVAGINMASYSQLRPYVTALPIRTSINVNTAPLAVLRAVLSEPDEVALRQFVQQRGAEPITDFEMLRRHALFANFGTELDGLGVGSDWFRLDGNIALRRATIEHHAILHRSEDSVKVVQRWSGAP
jgi:general secretion pathway protein K